MTSAAFDEILRRLVAAGAEFVVIGGLALGARGVVRATKNIDIVVSPDVENLKVVAEVAVAAGGHVQRGEALLGTPFSIAAELAGGEQMAIDTELGRLDIVQGLDGVPSFAELRSRASDAEVLGAGTAWPKFEIGTTFNQPIWSCPFPGPKGTSSFSARSAKQCIDRPR